MKRLGFVAMLVLAASAPSWAAGPVNIRIANAGDLADICGVEPKDGAADAKINFCHGFAQGAIDVQRKYAGDKKTYCMPTPAPTRTETMNQFVAWVKGLPAHRSLGPTDGFFQFLGERFPCK